MKRLVLLLIAATMLTSGCATDADIASQNLSKAADMFEVERKIVFYDAIQGIVLLTIEGRCSIKVGASTLAVTCKTSDTTYKTHYLGLSDNVTFFAEQLESSVVGVYNYRVIFKPESLIPNIDLETSITD